MPSVATRRLIDATATLDPADRALLNLWVNRGLPDEQLTRLTRLSPEALAQRRERIVERLGETLGLPDEDVTAALAELAAGVEQTDDGADGPDPLATVPGTLASADPPVVQGVGPRRGRRLRVPLGGLALLAIAAAVLVVALSSGSRGGSSEHRRPARGPRAALAGLPGGPAGAGGEAQVAREGGSLTLDLTVRSLPALPPGDHYEAWLFTSVVDSVALGRLPGPAGSLRVRLPGDAARYASIDVSLQSGPGAGHSGVSVLRAPNPLRAR